MKAEKKQCLLKYLDYYTGKVDNLWGPLSEKATKDFQNAEGLQPDGVFGDGTLAQVLDAVSNGRFKKTETPSEPDTPTTNAPSESTGETGTFWDDLKYFSRDEPGIRCPCPRCGGFPVEPSEKLMRMATKIREHFDAPMTPSSTVRCQAHNDELPGSAKNSKHIQGKAMDFAIKGVPVSSVIAYTKELKARGEINYTYEMVGTGYVHFDVL